MRCKQRMGFRGRCFSPVMVNFLSGEWLFGNAGFLLPIKNFCLDYSDEVALVKRQWKRILHTCVSVSLFA